MADWGLQPEEKGGNASLDSQDSLEEGEVREAVDWSIRSCLGKFILMYVDKGDVYWAGDLQTNTVKSDITVPLLPWSTQDSMARTWLC